jgi:hypothetical protein
MPGRGATDEEPGAQFRTSSYAAQTIVAGKRHA